MDLAGDKRVYQKVREITQIKYKILINNYLILIKKLINFPPAGRLLLQHLNYDTLSWCFSIKAGPTTPSASSKPVTHDSLEQYALLAKFALKKSDRVNCYIVPNIFLKYVHIMLFVTTF